MNVGDVLYVIVVSLRLIDDNVCASLELNDVCMTHSFLSAADYYFVLSQD